MSSAEFSAWLAYNRVEPFGPDRDDLRAQIPAWLLHSVHADKSHRLTLGQFREEFWPDWRTTPEEKKEKERNKMLEKMRGIAAALGGGGGDR